MELRRTAANTVSDRQEELVWEEVTRPWWLQVMIALAMGVGYGLRALGWLVEHVGKAMVYVGREMVLAMQRLDYPETQRLTEEQKRTLLEYERGERTNREGSR